MSCITRVYAAARGKLMRPPTKVSGESIATITSPTMLKSTIEVERKFVPTGLLRGQLNIMASYDSAPFQLDYLRSIFKPNKGTRVMQKPTTCVRDTYVDLNGKLVSLNIWLRRRSEEVMAAQEYGKMAHSEVVGEDWEAKVRIGGNYTDSQFEEVKGKEAVMEILSKAAPGVGLDELTPFADLVTERQCWAVSDFPFGEMSIVLDSVKEATAKVAGSNAPIFRHDVGEVELMTEVVGGSNEAKHQSRKKAQAEVLRARLDEFMEMNKELFLTKFGGEGGDEKQVVGKLSAYVEWKKKMQELGDTEQ